jgi:hypothetical protein
MNAALTFKIAGGISLKEGLSKTRIHRSAVIFLWGKEQCHEQQAV